MRTKEPTRTQTPITKTLCARRKTLWGKTLWGKTLWGKTLWGKTLWGKTLWGKTLNARPGLK